MEHTTASLNFDKICRVCLTESQEMHSLFSQDENCYLSKMLMSISSMKVRYVFLFNRCLLKLVNIFYRFWPMMAYQN